MAKKVGIFGGSFNPIHNGHIALAGNIVDNTDLDELWMMVSPLNPLKQSIQDTLIDNDLRLKMVEIAVRNHPELKASDVEFALPKPNYTINTLNYLENKYKEYEFSLIMGTDNLLIFDNWKNSKEILEKYRIIVYPRIGSDIDELRKMYPKVEILEEMKTYNVSSTEVRRRIKYGESIDGMIDDKVAEFIKERNLYK